MFPDSWDKNRIMDEVEHAVKNNKGLYDINRPNDGYFGYSKDGQTKIRFYYNDSTGKIGSYFPSLK